MTSRAALPPSNGGSFRHRINHTPLRDVLRGRFSGRLDVAGIIAESGLPSSLEKIVDQTVRRTRLWRIEKADVAHELVAHFQDGIAAGATPEALAKSFGDVPTAARLIRRARTRTRPVVVKAFLWSGKAMGLAFGLFLVAYIWFAIRLYVGEPKITRDYIAEYNTKVLAVPEGDRAWPLYREASVALGGVLRDIPGKISFARPGGPVWEECASFAAAHGDIIELFRQAAAQRRCAWVMNDPDDAKMWTSVGYAVGDAPEEDPMLGRIMQPPWSVIDVGADMVAVDAYQAILEGDGGRAMVDIETILQMVEHVSEDPSVSSDLRASFLLLRGLDVLGCVLRDYRDVLADAELTRLSHGLAGVRGGGPLRLQLDMNIAAYHDLVQRCYSDDGHGDGLLTVSMCDPISAGRRFTPEPPYLSRAANDCLAAPVVAAVVAGRRNTVAEYERHMALVASEDSLPLWNRAESQAECETERIHYGLHGLRFMPGANLLPPFSGISFLLEYTTQERDAVLVAIALELHRRRVGAYPPSLEGLTPDLLLAVPLDRYDGKPLKYRLVEGRPVLYSVGTDRDDDGGRLPDASRPSLATRMARKWRSPSELRAAAVDPSVEPIADGDWVLWPPVDDPPDPDGG